MGFGSDPWSSEECCQASWKWENFPARHFKDGKWWNTAQCFFLFLSKQLSGNNSWRKWQQIGRKQRTGADGNANVIPLPDFIHKHQWLLSYQLLAMFSQSDQQVPAYVGDTEVWHSCICEALVFLLLAGTLEIGLLKKVYHVSFFCAPGQ